MKLLNVRDALNCWYKYLTSTIRAASSWHLIWYLRDLIECIVGISICYLLFPLRLFSFPSPPSTTSTSSTTSIPIYSNRCAKNNDSTLLQLLNLDPKPAQRPLCLHTLSTSSILMCLLIEVRLVDHSYILKPPREAAEETAQQTSKRHKICNFKLILIMLI